MRFLIDEDLPRSIKDLLERYGHEAFDVRVTGFRGSKDRQIAALAQRKGLCLVTGTSISQIFGTIPLQNTQE